MQPPVETKNLPTLDKRLAEAICLEHRYSILRFATTLLGRGWNADQIQYAASRWTWQQLARAVAWERGRLGQRPIAHKFLADLAAGRIEQPGQIYIPPQPPSSTDVA